MDKPILILQLVLLINLVVFTVLFISSGQGASALSPYEILAKKAEYAQDILMMYDIICPGYTKERGLTLFELFAARFNMIKLDASPTPKGDKGERIRENIR